MMEESPIDIKKITALVAVALLCAGIVFWFSFGGVSDNRSGADAVRQQLEQVRVNQQSAIDRIDKVQTGLDSGANRIINSTERITVVERRIETSQAGLDESANIIRDSQSILERVRSRGQN